MNASKKIKTGDSVEWNSPQGKVQGTVKKEVTQPMKIKGHEVKASPAKPQLLVESKQTGAKAAHRASALKKTGR